ncbi:6890_t:CDS:2 [Gigaspora margarita]|uniref:6890_t:CDS:1 n=1 Tax=Gigaspora margarita TaxID=4874 RepID=A0ABM8VY21_GIGMA|nr:6890_t:CDS:2 [Gigaspora margarita]
MTMPLTRQQLSLIDQNYVVPYWNDQSTTPKINGNHIEIKHKQLTENVNNDDSKSHNGKRKKVQTTRRAKRRKKESLIRSIKIRVYPNALQKNLLKQWIGCARLVYNMVVANYMRSCCMNKQFFFRILLKHRIQTTKEWAFMEKVPYKVLDHSITSAILARDEVIQRNHELRSQGLALDDLISRTIKAPANKCSSMKRAQAHEVYKKAALWLTRIFDIIVLPVFAWNMLTQKLQETTQSSQTNTPPNTTYVVGYHETAELINRTICASIPACEDKILISNCVDIIDGRICPDNSRNYRVTKKTNLPNTIRIHEDFFNDKSVD